jgi:hypothetical protein
MANLFDGAPKPSLLDGELAIDESAMADVAATIDREQQNLKAQQEIQKKILNFNGSSYSGVDIKVLVHKYGSPSVDLKADIERAIAVYRQIQDLISGLSLTIIPKIISLGSLLKRSEITSLEYAIALEDYRERITQIHTLENNVKDTGFMQFIGSALNGRLADIQRVGFPIIAEFTKLNGHLDKLLQGWQSQAQSIGSRSNEFVTTKVLAELQTISISTFREKVGVRACGNVGVKGYTRGPRTVAGSMIFTVFDKNVLFELLETSQYDADDQFRAAIKDQLPPIDLSISFANEYGALSRMSLYGVEFVSEGQTMSIEDIILEDVCQFVARDVDPMTPVVNAQGEPYNVVLNNYNQAVALGRGGVPVTDLRASDLRGTEWDRRPGNTPEKRFRDRQNPFF